MWKTTPSGSKISAKRPIWRPKYSHEKSIFCNLKKKSPFPPNESIDFVLRRVCGKNLKKLPFSPHESIDFVHIALSYSHRRRSLWHNIAPPFIITCQSKHKNVFKLITLNYTQKIISCQAQWVDSLIPNEEGLCYHTHSSPDESIDCAPNNTIYRFIWRGMCVITHSFLKRVRFWRI